MAFVPKNAHVRGHDPYVLGRVPCRLSHMLRSTASRLIFADQNSKNGAYRLHRVTVSARAVTLLAYTDARMHVCVFGSRTILK